MDWDKFYEIDGWYTRREAELLIRYVSGAWCEIGCWEGKSTLALASTGKPGWAIDWFKGSPEHPRDTSTLAEFQKNLAGYDNVVTIIGKAEYVHSQVGQISLLHLDGEHSYSATKRIFDLYSPKVDVGGCVVVHDAWGEDGEKEHTPWPEVTRFVNEVEGWRVVDSAGRSAVLVRR